MYRLVALGVPYERVDFDQVLVVVVVPSLADRGLVAPLAVKEKASLPCEIRASMLAGVVAAATSVHLPCLLSRRKCVVDTFSTWT